jgi:glycosyltransferase involved in cell wall biosynthesis
MAPRSSVCSGFVGRLEPMNTAPSTHLVATSAPLEPFAESIAGGDFSNRGDQRMTLRYCFITTGSLEHNASFMRLREFGRCLAVEGVDVHYVIDAGAFNDTVPTKLPFATCHRVDNVGRLGRLFTRRALIRAAAPDVIHLLNPQPSNSATIFGTRAFVVGDWDELLSTRSKSASMNALSRMCEAYGRRRANLTVVSSRHMQQLFRDRHAVDSLYLPYATYIEPHEDGATPFKRPSAVYLGNFHHDSDHDILLEAWAGPLAGVDAPDLHMIGGGTELGRVRNQVAALGLRNVYIHGFLPWSDVWRHLRHASVLVFPIRDTPGNRMRCPAKTFAYMQAARPIITNRVGEVAEVLRDLATYVEPSAEAFAAAVMASVAEPRPDVLYPLDAHTWPARTDALLDAVEQLRDRKPPREKRA